MLTKKLLVVSVIMALAGGSALFADAPKFALSAGAGGIFVIGFGHSEGNNAKTSSFDLGGGGFAFLDATFAELSVGYASGRTIIRTKSGGETASDTLSVLDVDLLGKYPFNISRISLFPLFGVNYQHAFSPGDKNIWRMRFGGGMDYKVTDKLYLRCQGLSGFHLDGVDLSVDVRAGLALGYIF
jgi:opacity protein-like surface antigen